MAFNERDGKRNRVVWPKNIYPAYLDDHFDFSAAIIHLWRTGYLIQPRTYFWRFLRGWIFLPPTFSRQPILFDWTERILNESGRIWGGSCSVVEIVSPEMLSLDPATEAADTNGEPSTLGGNTGPGWKAACFDFWRKFFKAKPDIFHPRLLPCGWWLHIEALFDANIVSLQGCGTAVDHKQSFQEVVGLNTAGCSFSSFCLLGNVARGAMV